MPYQLILSIRLRPPCYMGSTHWYLNLVLKEDRTLPLIVTIWYHKGMTSEFLVNKTFFFFFFLVRSSQWGPVLWDRSKDCCSPSRDHLDPLLCCPSYSLSSQNTMFELDNSQKANLFVKLLSDKLILIWQIE